MRQILCYFYTSFLFAWLLQLSTADTSTTLPLPAHHEYLLHLAEAAIADCYEDEAETIKVEITDEGFDVLLKGAREEVPRNTKCLRYCIMRKNKLFNANNMLDIEEMLSFYKNVHSSIEEETLKEVLNTCNDIAAADEDRCERAAVATKCILDELNEQGVTDI